MEKHLDSSHLSRYGPFVIGKEITYADLVLFQDYDEEDFIKEGKKALQDYPRSAQLVDGVQNRPNIKAFLGVMLTLAEGKV